MFRSPYKYFWLTFLLIAIDQLIKYAVHHYLVYEGNEVSVFGHWFKLRYVLSNGMAFGLGRYEMIFLNIFRILFISCIGYLLVRLTHRNVYKGFLLGIALFLAGAIGNQIDRTFYGILIDSQSIEASTPWFHGQIISMFFFDLYEGLIPMWSPFLAGTWFSPPIFNFADASIFCGITFIFVSFLISLFKVVFIQR